MTKQKVIEKFYGSNFAHYLDRIDYNGWFDCGYCVNGTDDAKEIVEEFFDLKFEDGEFILSDDWAWWRPSMLQGIENNNNWIVIDSDGSSLPNTTEERWVKHKDGDILTLLATPNYLYKNCTHYQPIIKPKPPIY